MRLPPELIGELAAFIHPSSLAAAVIIPNLRALIRVFRRSSPLYLRQYVVHDAMSGLALPSFIALCMLPIAPSLRDHLDTTHLFLAGVLGIVFVVTEVVSTDY